MLSSSWLDAAAVELRNRFADRRFRSHHRLDVEAGHELDVVHGENVGGIGHRDGQDGANARKRNDLIAKSGVLRDQLDNVGIDFVIFQVDGGNAVLARQHSGDVIIGDETHFRQATAQLASVGPLKLQRLIQADPG